MNLKICRQSLLIITFCFAAFGCGRNQPARVPESVEITERKIVYVKIPPVRDPKLSAEERFWQMQKFLFPQITIPKKIPKGLPFDHSLFDVKLKADGSIELNYEKKENAGALETRLAEIFQDRTEKRVFEPNSEKVVKGVLVSAPDSAKYSEVFDLLEHVENSGADPIVLLIGELPTAAILTASE